MAVNKSKKTNRINIKNMVYALLTSDTTAGAEYGEVKPLGKAMQVQLTPSLASGVLYGEGAQSENIAKLNGMAAVLDVNKIAIEDRAEILGHKYENGILIEKAGDENPIFSSGI